MNIRLVPSLLTTFLVVLTGCASQNATIASSDAASRNADDLLVIDCMLPGQIRKLGQNFTYLAPRRAARTTAVDCEIRGGEYVAYDRASYATALKVWLPLAQEGDPAAQVYVGEIYEKGLGIEADYPLAASWYRKSAEQGYSRARINLGYLYESGLGVERDLVKAMNFYRQASGLTDGEVEYVSSLEATQREAAKQQTVALKQEVGQLSTELGRTKEEFRKQKAQLADAERDLSALEVQLEKERQSLAAVVPVTAPVSADDPLRIEIEQQLSEVQGDRERLISKLAEEQLKVSALTRDMQRSEKQLADRRRELDVLEKGLVQAQADAGRKNAVASASREAGASALLNVQLQLERAEAMVAEKKVQIAALEEEEQSQKQSLAQMQKSASGREKEMQKQLEQRSQEVIALELQLSERDEVLLMVQNKLQDAEQAQNRLTASLATQQLDALQLREDLDKTTRQLQVRQIELNTTKNVLAQTGQELEQQKTQKSDLNKQEIASLEARVRELTKTLESQNKELGAMEQESGSQQTRLSGKLAEAEISERGLQRKLNERNREISSLQTQLAVAGQKAIKATQNDEKVSRLVKNLEQREKEIARKKQEISALHVRLGSQGGGLRKEVAFASLVAARSVGPSIEIIEPPVAILRGKPSVKLLSEMSALEIIGRVSPASELMSFRINDKPRATDADGLFKVEIEVKKPDTPIHAVAIDKVGRRVSMDFLILPKLRNASSQSETQTGKSVSALSQELDFGEYHALIIGNNNYTYMPNLRTAVNDAEAVERLLRTKYGFKTQLLLNADRYTMLSALNKLMQDLTEDDNLLIYYAGHGELDKVNLRGYWLPVDAEHDSTTNWISNVTVTDTLNVMSARHVLVVADSCYSGALTRASVPRLQGGMSSKVKTEWYKAMTKARARSALTSGGVKPVLDSGGGEHSIFAQAFIEVLEQNEGILEGYRLYRDVQAKVKSNAAAMRIGQNPQYAPIKYSGHEAGEFFFKPADADIAWSWRENAPDLLSYMLAPSPGIRFQ